MRRAVNGAVTRAHGQRATAEQGGNTGATPATPHERPA
jgi:hypothetical protein